jgi:hypothetical protein
MKHGLIVKKYGEDETINELSLQDHYEAFEEAAEEARAMSEDNEAQDLYVEVYNVDDEDNIIETVEGPLFSTWDKDKEDEIIEMRERGEKLYDVDDEGELTYAAEKKEKNIKANEKFVVVVGIEVEAKNEDDASSKVSKILIPKQDNKEIRGYYIDYVDFY